jgi:predicted DNA-binding transcriptional regulator YafY
MSTTERNRIARLLALIRLLQDGRSHKSDDVARKLGVSRRTVFRDLRALRDAGVAVISDRATGIRLPSTYINMPPDLARPEVVGLAAVRRLLQRFRGQPHIDVGLDAIERLWATVPDALREESEWLIESIRFCLTVPQCSSGHLKLFERLHACVQRRAVCEIALRPSGTAIRILPRSLELVDHGWYIAGRRLDTGAVEKVFLANIQSVQMADDA